MRVFVCANVFVLPTCVLRFFSEGGYPFSSRFRCSPDLTPFFVIVKRAYKIPGQPSAASELTRDRAKGRWSCIPPPEERENTAVFLSSQKAPFLLFVAWAHQFFSIAFFIHFLKSSTKAYLTPRVVSCVFLSFLKNKTKQQKLCDWFSFGALISAKAKHSRRAIFVALLHPHTSCRPRSRYTIPANVNKMNRYSKRKNKQMNKPKNTSNPSRFTIPTT